jgi:hypothetical protein
MAVNLVKILSAGRLQKVCTLSMVKTDRRTFGRTMILWIPGLDGLKQTGDVVFATRKNSEG